MKNTTKLNMSVGKLGVVFVVCLAMIMTSSVIAVENGSKMNQYLLNNQMVYSFDFKEPVLQAASEGYTGISMPGCLTMAKTDGNPALPVKFVSLLLPPMETVSQITVQGTPVTFNLRGVDLSQRPLFPQQHSVPIGEDIPEDFIMNTGVYTANTYYPAGQYTDYQVGYSHGYTILSFSLNPVQYNPVQGTIVYYQEMTVSITLQSTNTVNQFYSNNPSDKTYVQSLVSNPEIADLYQSAGIPVLEYDGGLCDPSDHYDYVIITTTQNGLNYWDTSGSTPYNWQSLINHHAGDGLSGTVVTVQDIWGCSDYYQPNPFNDSRAQIREFCKDAYEDWGTRYILIAGDADTITARQFYYSAEGNFDSDVYWSNLDNDFNNDHDSQWGESGDTGYDLYAEIYIGRVTCDVPQDVSNWLTKCFYYAESSDWDYLDNAGFFGGALGFPGIGGDDFIEFSALKGTSDYLGTDPHYAGPYPTWAGFTYGFETWNEVNVGNQFNLSVKVTDETPPNPGWSGGGSNTFKNAINNDEVTLISCVAHANEHMSMDVYDSAWITDYHNTRPFFLTDYGCHCGDFDAADDGVVDAMLFHSDTELAFACVYNTAYGWGQYYCTNSSSAWQQKLFWDYIFDMENNSQDYSNWQIGKGHAWSKDMMAPMIDWGDYQESRGTMGCCLLFGDPAQMIKSPSPSNPPNQPSKPIGPTLGIWNVEYTYTSSTSDPDGDQIYYLFDWGDGSNSGWIGPYASGVAGVTQHMWTTLGTFDVKVKARDVWGAGSKWSEVQTVTIRDNNPPSIPEVTGPAEGKPGSPYLFNFVSEDLDGHDISYFIDWGDNTTSDWMGPYVSGTILHQTHTWAEQGTYTVKAKAKDSMGAESDWGTFEVAMPVDYHFSLSVFLQHLFEKFPNMFPILRHVLGY
jgi:hypothetical protein